MEGRAFLLGTDPWAGSVEGKEPPAHTKTLPTQVRTLRPFPQVPTYAPPQACPGPPAHCSTAHPAPCSSVKLAETQEVGCRRVPEFCMARRSPACSFATYLADY